MNVLQVVNKLHTPFLLFLFKQYSIGLQLNPHKIANEWLAGWLSVDRVLLNNIWPLLPSHILNFIVSVVFYTSLPNIFKRCDHLVSAADNEQNL